MGLRILLFLAANYTTYLGGVGPDVATGMAVDYAGAVYVAGTSSSTNFPITSIALGGPAAGHHCGFVSKLTPDGSALEFSVCIPDLIVNSFALDPSGAMYIAVTNLDYSQSVLKLDRGAQKIVYTSPLDNYQISAIAVDPYGVVYVTGAATALTATPGAYQPQVAPGTCHTGAGVQLIPVPCTDAFVAKLARDGTIVYATYLGGSGPDHATAIAIDAFGDAWITGTTVSPDFPTTINALQNQFHGEVDLGPLRYGDAFIAEVDPTGSRLLYSSYLGGSVADGGNAVAVDGTGAVYAAGFTQSPDFPVSPGGLQTNYEGNTTNVAPGPHGNGFLVKFDAGGKLIYSTYLGGMTTASGSAITSLAVNAQRQTMAASTVGVEYIVNESGSSLVCQAPIFGNLIGSDGTDNIYAAGTTLLYSPSIATPGALQAAYGGGDSDVVVQASDASRCLQAPTK